MQSYEKLEHEFASWLELDPQCMVACNSGTAALHLAATALELPIRGQILIPEFTIVSCARAAALADLYPVFVDCADNLLMETACESYMTSKTCAIMPVHIYGRRFPVNELTKYSAVCIEDLAEAHGIKPHEESAAACWSFYQNKIVRGEEGGAVYFKSVDVANIARELRCIGFTARHNFLHRPGGMNYRLPNFQASLIRDSLKRADENIEKRRNVANAYDKHIPQEMHMPPRDVDWVYDIKLPEGIHAEETVRLLNAKNVPARVSFRPMSQQTEFKGHFKHLNAYRLSQRVIYFPVYPDMTEEVVKDYVDIFFRTIKS